MTIRLNREPALLLIGFLAPVIQLLTLILGNFTVDQQGAVNAAAAALASVATALVVRAEGLSAVFAGAAQAVIACAISFGANLSPEIQTSIMTISGLAVAAYVRTQVTAPVPPSPAAVIT
jgi:hypothetical protein